MLDLFLEQMWTQKRAAAEGRSVFWERPKAATIYVLEKYVTLPQVWDNAFKMCHNARTYFTLSPNMPPAALGSPRRPRGTLGIPLGGPLFSIVVLIAITAYSGAVWCCPVLSDDPAQDPGLRCISSRST